MHESGTQEALKKNIPSIKHTPKTWGFHFIIPSIDTGLMYQLLLRSHFSRVQLFATPWTVARQAPLSMGFSRQECWSRLPFPFPQDLPNPGIEPASLCLLHWPADSVPLAQPGKPFAGKLDGSFQKTQTAWPQQQIYTFLKFWRLEV